MFSQFLDSFRSNWLINIFGIVLGLTGTFIIFWNEKQNVHNIIALQEVLNETTSIRYDSKFDTSLEGQLVHISGPLMTGEPLTEIDYNIMVQAVKLKRRVQMFQWIEETIEHKFGDSVDMVHTNDDRTYYYTTQFSDYLIDHRSFYIPYGHENPKKFPLESSVMVADTVKIGQYELGQEVKNQINNFIEVTSDTRPEDPSIKLHAGLYYHCDDVFNPKVGDIRIQFSFAGLQGDHYTVVGRVLNKKIVPYASRNGKKILLIKRGELGLEDLLKHEYRSQRMVVWGVRLVGAFFIYLSITCVSQLLTFTLSQNRVTQHLAPNRENPLLSNIALALSSSMLIVSIAWILYRPWLGFTLICTAFSPILLRRTSIVRYNRIE